MGREGTGRSRICSAKRGLIKASPPGPGEPAGGSGGKRCTWTGAAGGGLTIETADPETFDALREAAYEPQDVPGLGSGAYWSQTGANGKLVVHGGAVVLLIEASEGREFAESAARAMLAVLEQHGLRRTFSHHGIPWQVAGLER